MDSPPPSFLSSIPIRSVLQLSASDGRKISVNALEVTPSNIAALAERSSQIAGRPYCTIARRSTPDETFTSSEHFVPEGLGYSWARLPKGTGTCDRVNQQFSRHEEEWLRYGALGVLRPFYVARGKKDAPFFFGPTKSDAKISFTQNSRGQFQLAVGPEALSTVQLPAGSFGPGTLSLQFPATEANACRVSLALHKMVVLAMWLEQPAIVHSALMDDTLAFLNSPREDTYRPFWQSFLAGAPPGVELDLGYEVETPEAAIAGSTVAADIARVTAVVRVHHMIYWLVPVGVPAPPAEETGWEHRPWEALASKERKVFHLSLSFDAITDERPEETGSEV